MTELPAGFAEIDFTPDPGLELRYQQYRRVAERRPDFIGSEGPREVTGDLAERDLGHQV